MHLIFCFLFAFFDWARGENPVSVAHPIEMHHSLHKPLDKSQVYWNFGGSTVLTRNLIRLTPSTQDRRGWLWNEYPLEAANWEVEFLFQVHSKPHFGGDGFAFWIIAGNQDPAFNNAPDALSGPLFGMKNDFQGFGVCFDIYDNDNRRNNPSIFVLQNLEGKPLTFNHDDDFTNDMVGRKPENLPFIDTSGNQAYSAHKCIADIRNTGKIAKALVKFLHKELHVYIDTNDGLGYKYCLAVQFEKTFVDYHMAFTAATGQVADNQDILEINTRYLAASDKATDDSSLPHYASGVSISWFSDMLDIVMVLGAFTLTVHSGYLFYNFYRSSQLDEVLRIKQLNHWLTTHLIVQAILTVLVLFSGEWILFFANLPLLIWRLWSYYSHSYVFAVSKFRGGGFGINRVFSTVPRLAFELVYYLILQSLYLRLLF